MNALTTEIEYPSSDGQPLAESTLQYLWIVMLHGGIEGVLEDNPNAFCAADNLIYPVEGRRDICMAPDVYVAYGPAPGHRGSYQVWREGGIFPQVIFEVLSPSNRAGAMADKLAFYDEYGAEEYYIYDPERVRLTGYLRGPSGLEEIDEMHGWVSPRLGIRFDMSGEELVVYAPNGEPFVSYRENRKLRDDAIAKAKENEARAKRAEKRAAKVAADAEKSRADAEKSRADAEKAKAQNALLLAKLRALGIDPDAE